jgi:hypothetical protein
VDLALLLLVSAVVGVGLVFVLLARWAQRQNKLLGEDHLAWKGAEKGISFKRLFFGTSSSIETYAGRALAVIVIVAVLAAMALLAYLILTRQS